MKLIFHIHFCIVINVILLLLKLSRDSVLQTKYVNALNYLGNKKTKKTEAGKNQSPSLVQLWRIFSFTYSSLASNPPAFNYGTQKYSPFLFFCQLNKWKIASFLYIKIACSFRRLSAQFFFRLPIAKGSLFGKLKNKRNVHSPRSRGKDGNEELSFHISNNH